MEFKVKILLDFLNSKRLHWQEEPLILVAHEDKDHLIWVLQKLESKVQLITLDKDLEAEEESDMQTLTVEIKIF